MAATLTATPTVPAGGEPYVPPSMILTTTFTPPPHCSTQFADRGSIYVNPEFPPVDPAQSTCYESQFFSYITGFRYEKLVCPEGYTTNSVFETPVAYIACCPSGFDDLRLYPDAPSSRPAYLAVCATPIPEDGLVVTYSDSTASALSTSTYTPTSGEIALAYAYDGIAAETANVTLPVETPVPSPTGSESGAGRTGVKHTALVGALFAAALLLS